MSVRWLRIPLLSSLGATIIPTSAWRATSASSSNNAKEHTQQQQWQQEQRKQRQWSTVARQQGLVVLLFYAAVLLLKGGQPQDTTTLPVIFTCLVLPPLVVEPLFKLFTDKDADTSNSESSTIKMEEKSSNNKPKNTTTVLADDDNQHSNSIDILQGSSSGLPSSPSLSSLSSAIKNLTISSCRKLNNNNSRKSFQSADLPLVLSDTNSLFASADHISKLTLQDITVIVQYSSQVNREGFDRAAFLSSRRWSAYALQVIASMDIAVTASRGPNVILSTSTESDHDALYFLAVSRIIAEWRSLRLVPAGYKRYALGVTLGRRDMIQNIAKVEHAVHGWIKEMVERETSNCNGSIEHSEEEHLLPIIQSPTLAQIVQHEVQTQVHPNLPRLADASGASGLLWLKRQLDYQTSMMYKSLQVSGTDKIYPTTKDAVKAAYREVYGSFHGWTTQQLFLHSFNGSPEFGEVYSSLSKDKVEVVLEQLQYDDDIDDDALSDDTNNSSHSEPENHTIGIPVTLQYDSRAHHEKVTPTVAALASDIISTGWCNVANSLRRFNCLGGYNPKQPTSSAGFLVVALDTIPQKGKSEAGTEALQFKSLQGHRTKGCSVPERMESNVSSFSDMTEESLAATSTSTRSTGEEEEEAKNEQSISMDQQIQLLSTELFQHLRSVHDLMSEFNMHDPSKV